MKVILQRDIPKVGKGGDVVNVADGYARNYLFPRQFAVPATGGFLKERMSRAVHEKAREEQNHKQAQLDGGKMQDLTLTITAKVGSGTKLYGSITAQDVADAVKGATGVEVGKRRVGLADPIKTLGTYTVPVRLHSDVSVTVTLDVTTVEELARREAAAAEAASAAEEAAAVEETETAEADTAAA